MGDIWEKMPEASLCPVEHCQTALGGPTPVQG